VLFNGGRPALWRIIIWGGLNRGSSLPNRFF